VLDAGALLSDTFVVANGLLANEAGDPQIKQRRRERAVSCSPGGVVADYVPFYFAARSPMMYKLWRGSVPTFTGDHRDLVYLVSKVDRIIAAGLDFAISDRNAAKALADFTNDADVLGDLTEDPPQSDFVDWPLMRAHMWNNTLDDGERMERRMAEFLVHDHVPLELVHRVAVHAVAQKHRIERLFADAGHAAKVVARPDWYYP
jgi:hypothetical protein